jgi:hypothetical protein
MPHINILSATTDDTNIFIISLPNPSKKSFRGANAIWAGVSSSDRETVEVFLQDGDYIQLEGTKGDRYTLLTPVLLAERIGTIKIFSSESLEYDPRGSGDGFPGEVAGLPIGKMVGPGEIGIVLEPTEVFAYDNYAKVAKSIRPDKYVILPSAYGISHFGGGGSGAIWVLFFLALIIILLIVYGMSHIILLK